MITCSQPLNFYPDHPILKVGVTVQIGLDKSVKLEKVFQRYVDFCNEQHPAEHLEICDLEFVHSQVLSPNDTAEAAALMKNDRIFVRPEQEDLRRQDELMHRIQRDSDKEYFQQFRQLLAMQAASGSMSAHPVDCYADVILECRGLLPTGNEQQQIPLSIETIIRAHSFLIKKRCPHLGAIISCAKQKRNCQSIFIVSDGGKKSESDDDGIEMLQHLNAEKPLDNVQAPAATQIENDDEESMILYAKQSLTSDNDDDLSFSATHDNQLGADRRKLTTVVIEDHPPDAIKLLLEYCYTNRVVPLGYEAFAQASKSPNESFLPPYRKNHLGPVPPHSHRPTRWPNCGDPVVSFAVALAGIRLAEEFEMHRLSLMCEVAAAQLVDKDSAVNALRECESQSALTGNELPRLRKAALEWILQCCFTGGSAATTVSAGLREHGCFMIPSLFAGILEALKEVEEKKKGKSSSVMSGEKRDWQRMALSYFDQYDQVDRMERERERERRARGLDPADDNYTDDDEADDTFVDFETRARNLSFKRMSRHSRKQGFESVLNLGNTGLSRRGGKPRRGGSSLT